MVLEHKVFFQVCYTFSTISMLAEPLMLVTGFFCFFLVYCIYMPIFFIFKFQSLKVNLNSHGGKHILDSIDITGECPQQVSGGTVTTT